MPRLQRAFNQVRRELHELGVLDGYLDTIDCTRTILPTLSCLGYVYDQGVHWLPRLAGFEPGVIYVPINAPVQARIHGSTLIDTLRHEYAHAWAWFDRRRIDGGWFKRAFGGRYGDDAHRTIHEPVEHHYVSAYATTRPSENFAETLMVYMRHRRSLARFESRPAVCARLRAVEEFVADTARRLR